VNVSISDKFAAFAAAMTMNGLILAGVAYLFDTQSDQNTVAIADSGLQRQCGCLPREHGDCRCAAAPRL